MKLTFLFLSLILSSCVFCQNLDIEEKDSLLQFIIVFVES